MYDKATKRIKILIADDFHPVLIKNLQNIKEVEAVYKPNIQEAEILQIISSFEGFVVRSKIRCNEAFFDKAINLRFIARGGSGLDNIDENQAFAKGVVLLNAPEANSNAVAEHALGLLLALSNNFYSSFTEIKNGMWNREKNRGIELRNKTIGIIGFGNNGSALARLLSGFQIKVLAYDKYKEVDSIYAKKATMQEIYSESDILSLHIPLTKETMGMVNREFLTNFLKPIVLINTSRGKIVDSKDIFRAIVEGKVSHFGADVLEEEEPQNRSLTQTDLYSKIFSMPNVLVTPHVAGWTSESYRQISDVLSTKIKHFLGRL